MTHPIAIIVRDATPDDVPLLAQLIRELADYEKLSEAVTGTPELLREHLFGPSPSAAALMAFADGDPAGFAVYFRNFSTFLAKPGIYLEDIFVRPPLRGRGIGKALFRHVVQNAQRLDAGRVEWSVLDWNEPAIRFYRSLGAKPLEEWTTFRLDGDHLNAFLE